MNRPSVHTVCQFIFIFYKSGRYDLLCNSLYNATYRKQNKTKKEKQYKWNCTKQHRAINNPYNNIFHIFEVFPLPNPGDPPSVRSQLLLEGDWASFILDFFVFLFWVWLIKLCLLKNNVGGLVLCSGFLSNWQQDWEKQKIRFGKLFTYNQPSGLGCFWSNKTFV